MLTIAIALTALELSVLFTPYDLKRLESYANNMLDYHVILDLLPTVASLYFENRFVVDQEQHPGVEDIKLSAIQSSILLAIGLQRKSVEEIEVGLFTPCCVYSFAYQYFPGRASVAGCSDVGALCQGRS
jgi:N-acetyltransferase 10